MSRYYLAVANPDATPASVSTTSLVEEILRRWPDARIELPEQGEFSVRWEADVACGELFRDGQGISIQGDETEVRAMVIAFRRLLGKDLTFTDEGYDGSVVVTEAMTADQLHTAYDDDVERNRRVWYLVVAPPGAPELPIATLTAEVDRRWPDAHITIDAWGPFSMWWSAKSMGHYIDGKISRHGELSIAGPFDVVVDFAVWVRRTIGRDVAFRDDRNAGSVEVVASMTADELATAYEDARNRR